MVILVGLVVVAVFAYLVYKRNFKSAVVSAVEAKGTAFARLAEQEGKIIALKAATEVKKMEAAAVHAVLDEVDKFLG